MPENGHAIRHASAYNKYEGAGEIFRSCVRTQAQVDFLRAYCMIGDRRLIANAIEEGIDVNSKTKDGRTTMHLCARIGNVHVLKFLIIKCGGNANARNGRVLRLRIMHAVTVV